MDPITIIGLVSTTMALIGTSAKIAQSLNDIAAKYNSTNTILNQIVQECRTLEAAVTQIQLWIERTLARMPGHHRQRMLPLDNALADFVALLNPLHEEVENMLSKHKPSGLLLRRVRFQSIWNEARMKEHLDALRWKANAIQLLLASTRLSPEDSFRRMEGIARAASQFRDSSLFNETGSTIDEVAFEFDDDVVNSAIYRKVMKSHLRQASAQSLPQPAEAPTPATIKEPTDVQVLVSKAEENLIDLSSEIDVPLTDASPNQAPHTPTHSELREMEESQRWEPRMMPDGRIFYWNSLTNSETPPAFQIASSEQKLVSEGADIFSESFSEAKDTTLSPETRSPVENTATSHINVQSSFTEVISPLLPSPPPPDYGDWSNLQIAMCRGNIDVLESYLATDQALHNNLYEGRSSRSAPFMMSSLHFACLYEHEMLEIRMSVIKWLLEHGSSPDSKDSDGDSPMHYLAQSNDVSTAALLLQWGPDLNIKGVKGYTPLHQATHYGALEMVRFLLENGASTTVRNDKGDTPATTMFNARGWDRKPIIASTKLQIRNLLTDRTEDLLWSY